MSETCSMENELNTPKILLWILVSLNSCLVAARQDDDSARRRNAAAWRGARFASVGDINARAKRSTPTTRSTGCWGHPGSWDLSKRFMPAVVHMLGEPAALPPPCLASKLCTSPHRHLPAANKAECGHSSSLVCEERVTRAREHPGMNASSSAAFLHATKTVSHNATLVRLGSTFRACCCRDSAGH